MPLLVVLLALRVFLPLSGPPGTSTAATPTPTATVTKTGTPTPTVTVSPTASPSPSATPVVASATPVVADIPPAPPTPPATSTASATATPTGTATITPTPTPPIELFALVGQSNMGLWERIQVPAAPEDAGFALAGLRWEAPQPGYAPGTTLALNGPGLAFGRAVARTGRRVGLVGCAVPGTGIRAWQKGQPLYDDCLAAVRATGLPLAGVIVYQGEADAFDPRILPTAAGDQWGTLFGAFGADWRADLDQPDLPIVYARLAHATSTVFTRWTTVQTQQDAARAPGVIEVEVEPVVLRDPVMDGVHLDDPSYALVGERLAAAWLARHP